MHLWARALVQEHRGRGGWVQVDRGALLAQPIFLTGDKREAYLVGAPADDARHRRTRAPGERGCGNASCPRCGRVLKITARSASVAGGSESGPRAVLDDNDPALFPKLTDEQLALLAPHGHVQ